MNKRALLHISLFTALSAVSIPASALTRTAGLNACADALVSELGARQGTPVVYNLDPESTHSSKRLNEREIYQLDAKDPANKTVVARFECVINEDAQVQRLTPVSLNAPDARLRATGLRY